MQPLDTPPAADEHWARYSAALTGPGQDYYLQAFRRIEAGSSPGLSWNWAAFVFTFAWLRYRRMYLYSWGYLLFSTPVLLYLCSNIPWDPCAEALAGEINLPIMAAPIVIAMGFILPAVLANRIYFRFIKRRELADPSPQNQAVGNIWPASFLMAGIVIVVMVMAMPSYGDYNTRAKISELILAASSYRTKIMEHHGRYGKLPANIDEIGGFSGPGGKVKAITLEKDSVIKIVAGFPPVEGRSIEIGPIVRDGNFNWTCRSHDIPQQCLPITCR